ncbi:protein deadlock [Drosophila subpulchrella]|uniref:protein deadlock n=1 Tax=Drosophila subpulchrella TaxID=1486046 RepID=UPI0018A1A3D2|nr:protein deadlock [Drosophila subpulchrella]
MKMRYKMSCWQQILTILGTSSIPDSEWAEIFAAFLDTWDNPYHIQTSTDPNIPIRTEYLVRPSKAFLESLSKGCAKGPKTAEFLEPTSSSVHSSRPRTSTPSKRRDTISHSLPRKAPSSGKRRDTIAYSVSDASANERRSLSLSTANSQLKSPHESEYAKIWNQRKSGESTKVYSKKTKDSSASTDDIVLNPIKRRESRASVSTAISIKRDESCSSSDDLNLSSLKRQDTSTSQVAPTSSTHKSRKSRSSAFTAMSTKRSDSCSSSDDPIFGSLKRQPTFALPKTSGFNPIKKRDSCDLPDDVVMNPIKPRDTSVSKSSQRGKSRLTTEEPKASSVRSIKRRNTCVSTHTPQNTTFNLTRRRDTVANPIKITQEPTNSFQNGCDQSSDECDDQLPLSKWLINKKIKQQKSATVAASIQKQQTAQDCSAPPPQVKRKRGRPSLQEKALQQARLEAELKNSQQPSEPSSKFSLIEQKKLSTEQKTKKQQTRPEAELREAQEPALKSTLIEQNKHSAERPKITPNKQKHQTKPLQKAAQKQLKEIQKRVKASPPKKTSPHKLFNTPQSLVKPTTHSEIFQQPQNLSKSSRKKEPSKSRLQVIGPISPHHKKRTMSNINAKTPLMPGHMPPTGINLKRTEVGGSAEKDADQKNTLSRGQPIRRATHLYEHNYNMAVEDGSHRGQPVYASNKMDEDQLEDDDMVLTSPVGGGEADGGGNQSIGDGESDLFDTPIEMFREVEEIDRCLENFINKTPSEIDSQLAHTTEFFEKLPSPPTVEENKAELTGIYMGEKEELDYEDDDDDVLSVATSWDGLDDESPPEPKPVEKLQTVEQKPEPSSKSPKEPPKRIVAAETPIVQSVKTFRIPKLSPEELKTQPSVMRSLYERQEIDNKEKPSTKRVPPLQVDPPQAASARQQRAEATAARRVKEPLPVFAPPYRVPPESTVPVVNANSKMFIPQLPVAQSPPKGNIRMVEVFGVKCMQSLDNRCSSFNCDHTLNSLGEVQRRLVKMDEETLVSTYRLMLRSFFIFQTYFTSFVEIFEHRQLRQQLLYMVSDCRFYKDISAPLLAHVYSVLQKCGMQEEAVACIMEHLWVPCKAHKFQDMTFMVLRILSNGNWENYYDKLAELKKVYKFEIPIENLKVILKSSEDHAEKFMKALSLITMHEKTTCHDATIISILRNKSVGAMQRQPVADSCPPSFVPPHAAGQQCPPFRGHPVLPNFREQHPPITAHNFNENNGFHYPNHFSNNLIKQCKRM